MERGHHYITRGLCAFMAVITAICALPAEGLAARKAEPLEAEEAAQTALEPGMKGEAKVSHELEAQRGRDTKQFYMSDGSYTAVQYAQPVHYRKNGTWAEIDNTLTRAAEGYVNTASDVRFTFSDDTASLPVVRRAEEQKSAPRRAAGSGSGGESGGPCRCGGAGGNRSRGEGGNAERRDHL